VTGTVAAIGFGIGLYLCSLASTSSAALTVGYFMLGFFGPCCQLPTLHLSCLFPNNSATVMSMQAAAFDGGSLIFYIAKYLYKSGLSLTTFFYIYLIIPGYILLVSLFIWPDITLDNADDESIKKTGDLKDRDTTETETLLALIDDNAKPVSEKRKVLWFTVVVEHLHGAPLKQIVKSKQFWFLTMFTSIHILKLNFIVDSIDEQLLLLFSSDTATAESLMWTFGWMLPLGFFVMPLSSYLLKHDPIMALQAANIFGIIYGVSINIPVKVVQLVITFPLVALSRQLVYSAVFHSIAELFGFINFGVILGLINLMVSALGALQYPIVEVCTSADTYKLTNYILACLSIPLFVAPFFVMYRKHKGTVVPTIEVASDIKVPISQPTSNDIGSTRTTYSAI